MQELPTELLEMILSYTSLKDSVNVMRVCKRWRNCLRDSKPYLKKIMALNMEICKFYQIASIKKDAYDPRLKRPGTRLYPLGVASKNSIHFKRFSICANGFHFGWGVDDQGMYRKEILLEEHTKSSRVKDALLLLPLARFQCRWFS